MWELELFDPTQPMEMLTLTLLDFHLGSARALLNTSYLLYILNYQLDTLDTGLKYLPLIKMPTPQIWVNHGYI